MKDYEASEALKQWWGDNWPATSAAAVAVLYPALAASGVPYADVDENASEPTDLIPWCEIAIEHGITTQWTMGSPAKYGTKGAFYIALRWPAAGTGDADDAEINLLKLGEAVRSVFQNKQIGASDGDDGVITYVPSLSDVQRAGNGDVGSDGRWWILAVSVPFEYTDNR